MKQRFSILRYGVRLNDVKDVDNIWLTCCALHNKLIFIDDQDKDWVGKRKLTTSNINSNDSNEYPVFSFARLNRNLSEVSNDNESLINPSVFDEYTIGGHRIVKNIPLKLFKQYLVNHFDIKFNENSIKWPSQLKNKPSVI